MNRVFMLQSIHAVKLNEFTRLFLIFQVALIGFNVLGDTVDGREFNTVVSELLPY